MDLSKIYSISGKGGLHKMIAQSKNGIIVESLVDGSRMPAFATQKIVCLEEIFIFKTEGEVKLKEIFKNIYKKENGKAISIDLKNDKEILKYFPEILPDYDTERVHISDMRKMFNWFNLLHSKGMVVFEEETKAEEVAIEETNTSEKKVSASKVEKAKEPVDENKESKPKKTTTRKTTKKEVKSEEPTTGDTSAEEKPKAKRAPRKKAE